MCHTQNRLVDPGIEEYLQPIWFRCSDEEMGQDSLGKVWWHLGYIACLCAWMYQRFRFPSPSKLGSTQKLAPCMLYHSSLPHCRLLLTLYLWLKPRATKVNIFLVVDIFFFSNDRSPNSNSTDLLKKDLLVMPTGHPMIIPAVVFTPVVRQIPLQPAVQHLQHGRVVTGMPPPGNLLHWEDAELPPGT